MVHIIWTLDKLLQMLLNFQVNPFMLHTDYNPIIVIFLAKHTIPCIHLVTIYQNAPYGLRNSVEVFLFTQR